MTRQSVQRTRVFSGLPPHGIGQRIGLYGGTFNPPHPGHRQVALTALNRLGLDQIWWLVTPGNPLKTGRSIPAIEERVTEVAMLAAHPRFVVTGIEASLGKGYTIDLILYLLQREPATRFVWIMGSDGLTNFHHWQSWEEIALLIPIVIVNRPGDLLAPLSSRAAQRLAAWRVPEKDAAQLPEALPPAWVSLVAPRISQSSTDLRASLRVGESPG